MKRRLLIAVITIGVVFFAIIFFLSKTTYKSYITLDGKIYVVDVADTISLREKGLSGRPNLFDNEGMFFVFDKPDKYGFWMKDMNFPIDILWLDQDYKIVYIEKSVSPSTYPKVFYPDSLSRYVLEIPSGQSKLLNIKIGDIVKFVRM